MQGLSYPTETVLSNKITRNRVVSFKDSPRKPLRRRPLSLSSSMESFWKVFIQLATVDRMIAAQDQDRQTDHFASISKIKITPLIRLGICFCESLFKTLPPEQ